MYINGELQRFWLTIANEVEQEELEKAISKEVAKHK